jgi:anaerobic magnesium-protoporphyrin IX monomethyl ester cyclase
MLKIPKANKSLSVVLVVPPPQRADLTWCPNLPITLAYLAAVLEKSGHEVTVIDCPALRLTHKQFGDKIASLKPDIVGITSLTPMIQSTLLAAHASKEASPETPVVLGGPHATFMDEQILNENPDVDIIVRGEGELTLLELADALGGSCGRDLGKVDGITFRRNDKVVRTPDRALIENLDDLPRPAYERLPLEKYRLFGRSIMPIMTSRGCPFRCTFCVSSQMNGVKFRTRNPKTVVDELEWLKNTHGADAYTFYDDAFTYDVDRAAKICGEMIKRKLGLPWDCQTRVDRISETILARLREAGCRLISFGIESGSQKILDAVGKKTTVEQNAWAIKLAKKSGISVSLDIILGYPGETPETLKQTIAFIKRTKPDYVYLTLAMPYPGTELFRQLKELGWPMSSDWSQYDLQTPVFQSPLIANATLIETRRKFYNDFYSPGYVIRQSLKRNFYSQSMARTALNHIIWRSKLPKLASAVLRK